MYDIAVLKSLIFVGEIQAVDQHNPFTNMNNACIRVLVLFIQPAYQTDIDQSTQNGLKRPSTETYG